MTDPTANDCCGVECIIWDGVYPTATDDYEPHWTELAGTWTYGVDSGHGYIETTSTGGIFLNTQAPSDTWTVRHRFTLNPTGSNTWRIGVGADISNYLFAEFIITKSGGFDFIQMRLGSVIAGSATYLGTAPYDATTVQLTGIFDGSDRAYVDFSLDDDGALSVSIGSAIKIGFPEGTGLPSYTDPDDGPWYVIDYPANSFAPLTVRNITPLGRFMGIFAVSLTDTLRIDQTRFYNTAAVDELCPVVVQSLTRGLPLAEVLLEISDSSPATITNWSGPCDLDCSKILGSFTLSIPLTGSLATDAARGLRLDTYSDSTVDNCAWDSELVSISLSLAYTLDGSAKLEGIFDRRLVVLVRFDAGNNSPPFSAGINMVLADKIHDVPMEEWVVDEWLDFTAVSLIGNCHSSGTLTCRIKRIS